MRTRKRRLTLLVLGLMPILAGCRQDMHDQPRYEPYEKSDFFSDGQTARPPIEGTVPRGWLRADDRLHRGLGPDGQFITQLPVPLSAELLSRGRQRFDIYCSPCHSRTGDGRGMIVRRGFQQPETFHQERLRQMPVGYFFDVMTNGFGQMSSYAAQVPVEDRWAIAAYVGVLQRSQYTPAGELATDEQVQLRESK